jgi:hypothetical protein
VAVLSVSVEAEACWQWLVITVIHGKWNSHTEQKDKPTKTYTGHMHNSSNITSYNPENSEHLHKKMKCIIAEQQVPSTQHLIHLMMASYVIKR